MHLAVPEYHAQGICCFEVEGPFGEVMELPDLSARTLRKYNKGEYVFACTQNFEGWIKLAGATGWLRARDDSGVVLLSVRTPPEGLDVWALSDLWSAARAPDIPLSSAAVRALKDLEKRTLEESSNLFRNRPKGELASCHVTDADTKRGPSWFRQRLFAGLLAAACRNNYQAKSLAPGFVMTPRPPQLLADEEEERVQQPPARQRKHYLHGEPNAATSEAGPFASVLQTGRGVAAVKTSRAKSMPLPVYCTASMSERAHTARLFAKRNGTLKTQGIVDTQGVIYNANSNMADGIWSASQSRVVPLIHNIPDPPGRGIYYNGGSFVLFEDNVVVDPETEEVRGIYCPQSESITFFTDTLDPMASAARADGQDPIKLLERGHALFNHAAFVAALFFYDTTASVLTRNMVQGGPSDFYLNLIRDRAASMAECMYVGSTDHDDLLSRDIDLLLAAYPKDQQALEWLKLLEVSAKTSMDEMLRQPKIKKCEVCGDGPNTCAACYTVDVRCGSCQRPIQRDNCCARCRSVSYCNRLCQEDHWIEHRRVCNKKPRE
eukprot:NODE_2862_length_2129_cov_5.362138.p1 GENE.NODE_2862_length_2129_cov_5.362138~~NODE_2862_length_2129_cov_5.362138.p1  ORF type:complete len:606 (-),score=127.01 NODE_2862_length_2129_cov_5.362138:312-1958(-)